MALAYPDSNDMSVLTVKGIQQILKSCSDLWFGKGRLTLQLALINSPRSYSILVTHQNDRKFISFNFFVKQFYLSMKLFKAGSIKVQTVGVRSHRPVRISSEFLVCRTDTVGVKTVRSENLEQSNSEHLLFAVRWTLILRTYYEFRDCFIHTESLILRKSI